MAKKTKKPKTKAPPVTGVEYRVENILVTDTNEQITEALNVLGADNWTMVYVSHVTSSATPVNTVRAIFMREL
jgi:hypothetical protein